MGMGRKLYLNRTQLMLRQMFPATRFTFGQLNRMARTGLSTSLWPLTSGDLGSYSPSIDDGGGLVVFDSFATNLTPRLSFSCR